jgi:apolipoprotein N-acyltransferase
LLRATNTGVSAIVDPKGRIRQVAPQFEVAALSGEVQPMRGATPYVRVGNSLVVIIIALLLVIPGILLRRRHRR